MALRIAIASGKGGTGKTTVSSNIFHYLSRHNAGRVMLVDCDVEEPNAVLFFPDAKKTGSIPVNQEIPVIDTSKCTFCRKCAEYCEFNAVVVMPPVKFAEINPSLCHSCGACQVACDHEAIWVKDESIGSIHRYNTGDGSGIMEGVLKIGSAMQTMVIRELKRSLPPDNDIFLFDAPPGTSCPVVETISDADYVILVTEPTPFGLHDMKLMIALVREMGTPFGVVINKSTLGNRDVYDYLEREEIEIIGEIPFNMSFAAQYSRGDLFHQVPAEIERAYSQIILNLKDQYGPRMKEITVISGKGGTGKTTITAAMASVGTAMTLCDGDVDAADLHLILHPKTRESHVFEGSWIARIDPEICTHCGICSEYCRFDAIAVNGNNERQIDPFKCEGCRLCERICPSQAISSRRSNNNTWSISDTRFRHHGPR